jgi:hypothetical protein
MAALSIIHGSNSELSHSIELSRGLAGADMVLQGIRRFFAGSLGSQKVALRLVRETVFAKVSFSEKAMKIAL